ncbi:MAG: hypothetical protein ACR2HF_08835 [Methylococcaceae bacterium]
MRVFFFLVVLANVFLLVFETGYRHPSSDHEAGMKNLALPGTTQSIALIGEPLPHQQAPAASFSAPVKPTPAPEFPKASSGNCLEIGPYPSTATAHELQELMQPHAGGITLLTRTQAQNDSWWVLIPKSDNMEVAKARRQMLLDKGVKDFWLFNKGELQGAISLGLHESRELAEAAQRQFLDKGIVSEIVPRSTHGETYWLRISWNRPALALDEVLQTLRMQNTELHIPAPEVCR